MLPNNLTSDPSLTTSVAIDIQGLTKRFGDKIAVNGISLRVNTGETFGFLGPNGSGKTTTIRMICGLLLPDAGSGTCLGYDILQQPYEIKQHVGYMPQRFSLYEDLSIYENLDFIARIYTIDNIKQRVEQSLESLGLQHRRQQLAGALSGGWKQRLALAAALLHQPKLLLLDEPTAGVDPKARRDFWDRIHLLGEQGITALVSTHYMDEAERCHRLAYIKNGNLLVVGTAAEIIAASGLETWEVKGHNLPILSQRLRAHSNLWQITAFGNTLHITFPHDSTLAQDIDQFRSPDWQWRQSQPNLEDIFVNLDVYEKAATTKT